MDNQDADRCRDLGQGFSNRSDGAANPIIGVRIVTSADAIQMTMNQLETGAFMTSHIPNDSATALFQEPLMC